MSDLYEIVKYSCKKIADIYITIWNTFLMQLYLDRGSLQVFSSFFRCGSDAIITAGADVKSLISFN